MRYDFASETAAPMAPAALKGLMRANSGMTRTYGADDESARAADLIRGLLDADAIVRFVATGTAGNGLALSLIARPFEAVAAHQSAHILQHEAGAPAFFGHGLGLIPIAGPDGKIAPAALADVLAEAVTPHRQPIRALSLTNATEYGTLYAPEELTAILALARDRGLRVHLDGARLANAAAAGFDLTTIKAFADVLVLGMSKAGAAVGDAVVVFDTALAEGIDQRLKQTGQLVANSRTISAPLAGLLEDGDWLKGAQHANATARLLAEAVAARTRFGLAYPVQANLLFLHMDQAGAEAVARQGFSVHRGADGLVRLVCSWATTLEAVEEITAVLAAA